MPEDEDWAGGGSERERERANRLQAPAHASVNPHNPASSSGGGEWSSRGNDLPREIAAAARGARGHADSGLWAGAVNFDGPAGGEKSMSLKYGGRESSGGSGAGGAGSHSDGGEGRGWWGAARVRSGSVDQQLVVASDNIQNMSSWEKVVATPPVWLLLTPPISLVHTAPARPPPYPHDPPSDLSTPARTRISLRIRITS